MTLHIKSPLAFGARMLRTNPSEEGKSAKPNMPGFCYLCLYDKEDWSRVATILCKYPFWKDVQELGGLRRSGQVLLTRNKYGVVHFITGGAGYPISIIKHYLKDDEVLGGDVFTPSFVTPYVILACILVNFPLPSLVENLIYNYRNYLYYITPLLVFPAWFVELCLGRLYYPDFSLQVTKGYRVYRKVRLRTTKFRLFVVLILLFSTERVDARIRKKVKDDIGDKFPTILAVAPIVHDHYLRQLTHKGPDTGICTRDYLTRFSVLDIDADDDMLISYITAMCPQLLESKINWYERAMDSVDPDAQYSVDRFISIAKEKVEGGASAIYKYAGGLNEILTRDAERIMDASLESLNKTGDAASLRISAYLKEDLVTDTIIVFKLMEESLKNFTTLGLGSSANLLKHTYSFGNETVSGFNNFASAVVDKLEAGYALPVGVLNYVTSEFDKITIEILSNSTFGKDIIEVFNQVTIFKNQQSSLIMNYTSANNNTLLEIPRDTFASLNCVYSHIRRLTINSFNTLVESDTWGDLGTKAFGNAVETGKIAAHGLEAGASSIIKVTGEATNNVLDITKNNSIKSGATINGFVSALFRGVPKLFRKKPQMLFWR